MFEVTAQRVPYGVVGVLSPWNFPMLLALLDAVPALVAGCAVIVKPSELTPRFIEPLQATIAESCPILASGVLQFVVGGPATGEAIVDHVDTVCFTGSVRVGRLVAQRAAARMIPCFLEMGGKDPAIVTRSADLNAATSAILWGATVNTGQSCLSIERVYVDETVADKFVELLCAKCKQLNDAKMLGPIISRAQLHIIRAHLDDARTKGATVACGGGSTEGPPDLVDATVLTGVDHTMLVMTEETFGPIIPVQTYSAVDEAVGLANDSPFGLSGAVFAGGRPEAQSIADRLNVGAVSINDAALTALVHDAEKASFGLSGVGPMSRMGDRSIFRFLRTKAHIAKVGSAPDPWWFDEVIAKSGAS